MLRSATTAASYPTDVPTVFNQYNAAGVSWKGYAQDLGGAQPVGATHYVTGSTPGVSDTVPGRDDGACGYPGTSSANPVTNPTNLVAPSGDVSSFTGAQPANANANGDPADQFVAKHFPFGWFTSLSGESAGTQSGVSYPAAAGAERADHPEYDGPGAPTSGASDTNCDPNHVTNLDDPTYGLVHDLSLPGQRGPGVQLDHAEQLQRRPRRDLPGQQPVGGVQRERHAQLHPGRSAGLRSGGDDADQLHRWAVRGRPVPALLHPADRAVGGVQGRRADRRHLRRGQPAVHGRQQLQQRAGSG
jgi:hypothetical protein